MVFGDTRIGMLVAAVLASTVVVACIENPDVSMDDPDRIGVDAPDGPGPFRAASGLDGGSSDRDPGFGGDYEYPMSGKPGCQGEACQERVLHCLLEACPALDDWPRVMALTTAGDLCSDLCTRGGVDWQSVRDAPNCTEAISVFVGWDYRAQGLCNGVNPNEFGNVLDAGPRTKDAALAYLGCEEACWVLEGCVEHDACGGDRSDRGRVYSGCLEDCRGGTIVPGPIIESDDCEEAVALAVEVSRLVAAVCDQ